MNTITFDHVLPRVFATHTDLVSDVWRQRCTFEKGHLYLVEADSGKGKSTFCSYILGYRNDFTGDLLFDSRHSRTLSVSEWVALRRCHIAHLFQELRLFPELTALENIEIKNTLTPPEAPQHKSREQVMEWLSQLGIADKSDTRVGLMSFGQQQRVALVRALAQPFDFLLADEPISHLDDTNAAIMAEIMMGEARRQGAAVIVTSIGKHMDLPYEHTIKL